VSNLNAVGLCLLLLLFHLLILPLPLGLCARRSPPPSRTRVVNTKQGAVEGIVISPDYGGLFDVDAFLGIPYAAAPVGR
jgi:hypothetical protein